MEEMPIRAKEIREATRIDPILSQVLKYTLEGWPAHLSQSQSELKPYLSQKEHLSVEQGCVLFDYRVIVPTTFQDRLLNELHSDHPGMCRMKALARCYVWWPSLNKDIESKVKSCSVCLAVQNTPQCAPLHPWQYPSRIWHRLHIDFAQKGRTIFLVVVDSYSKWLEIFEMKSTTAESTCNTLRTLFVAYGLPEEVVLDNRPQFAATVFKNFLKKNGVKQTLVAPYHPASNDAAERLVQILKRSLEKQVLESHNSLSVSHKLANFLFACRNTPHTVTGETPALMFLKRSPRTRLSLLHPNVAEAVESQRQRQQKCHGSLKRSL